MLTEGGPMCDVCGKYIMPIDPRERVNFFRCAGIENELMADNSCKELLESMMAADDKDWTKLPAGPLRRAFEQQEQA